MNATSNTSNTIETVKTAKLREVVGLLLAKHARKSRLHKRKTGYDLGDLFIGINTLKYEIIDKLLGRRAGGGYPDNYWTLTSNVSDARIRSAIKFWEKKGNARVRKGGRYGNSYRWVLAAEKHEWDRSARKRKERAAEWEIRDKVMADKTAEVQVIADVLSSLMGWEPKSINAQSDAAIVTRAQLEELRDEIADLRQTQTMLGRGLTNK
jgi:hypothetical protein